MKKRRLSKGGAIALVVLSLVVSIAILLCLFLPVSLTEADISGAFTWVRVISVVTIGLLYIALMGIIIRQELYEEDK